MVNALGRTFSAVHVPADTSAVRTGVGIGGRPCDRWFAGVGRLPVAAWVLTSAGFLFFLVSGVLGQTGTTVLDDYGSVLAPALAGAGCLRAARHSVGQWRRGWALMGASLLSWAGGGLAWSVYEVHFGQQVPFPSLADVGYLTAIPLALAGLLSMSSRGGSGSAHLRLLLDGSIAAAAIFFVSWATVLGPTMHAAAGAWYTRVIAIAYPGGDVLIASIVLLALARAAGGTRRTLTLIGLAQLSVAFSDSLFLWLTSNGQYATGNLIDAGWFSGYLLIGLASLGASTSAPETNRPTASSSLELLLPYAPMAIGVPFIVAWQLSGRRLDPVLFYDAVLLVLLVLGRQLLSLQANAALSRQLTDTVAALSERERELRHQAFHDPLTGLANRALFADRVGHALARGRRPAQVSVLLADLDDFKLVNDTLGHQAGDALLAAVAERLRASVLPGDTVARLGGDEFAVLLEDIDPDDDARLVAQRIADALEHPFVVAGRDVLVRASIGVAVNDGHRDGDALLRDADVAMYEAKRQGKGRYAVFEATLAAASLRQLRLKTDLTVVLDRAQLFLNYQPIVSLTTGRVVGFEALLRWTHPELGPISPDAFIPLAEDNGSILPIGRWLLQQACVQAARWQRLRPIGSRPLRMAVNVSGCQLIDPQLLPTVSTALRAARLDPELLTLEITESTLLADRQLAIEQLAALRALGVGIAIDDFGTGYSGMSRLRDYPITTVKVDKTFTSGLTGGGDQATVLMASIQQLGQGLGLHLIAEGVETEQQLATLRALGYTEGQGYLFSRPVPPGVIDDLVRSGIVLMVQPAVG
jgi:diguanylate cyclase